MSQSYAKPPQSRSLTYTKVRSEALSTPSTMPPFLSINRFAFTQIKWPRLQTRNTAKFPPCICHPIPLLHSRRGEVHPALALRLAAPNAGTVPRQHSILWFVPSFDAFRSLNVCQVVGARGTGKTSLLRLLLETADLSPTATGEQRAALESFLKGGHKHTQTIDTACVEICESRYDRVLLTVIDTPGLDFTQGKELSIERQVTNIIKYIDEQYGATMNEVRAREIVVDCAKTKLCAGIQSRQAEQRGSTRASVRDTTRFLRPRLTIPRCIFMIDPTLTRTRGQVVHERSVSETTISLSPATDQPVEYSGDIMMSPAELRVIKRLSARANVLPVIAKADSLTDESLSAVKTAVREGLRYAGLGFGVFSAPNLKEEPHSQSPQEEVANGLHNGINGAAHHAENGDTGVAHDDTENERVSRTIITLKGTRTARSRSRSRRDLSSIAQDERQPQHPDETEEESVANIRFSAKTVTKVNLDTLLPFAFIAPELSSTPQPRRIRPATADSKCSLYQDDTEGASSPVERATTPDVPTPSRKSTVLTPPPESLKGVFTRKFRWGTVDVLDPAHCDFAALRTAILLTHMKVSLLHFTWLSCHSRI